MEYHNPFITQLKCSLPYRLWHVAQPVFSMQNEAALFPDQSACYPTRLHLPCSIALYFVKLNFSVWILVRRIVYLCGLISRIILMKKLIRNYVSFNAWANERICSEVMMLKEDELQQEIKSSFRNIRETLLHIWDAQEIWMERFDGTSPARWPSASFKGNRDDLIDGLMASSQALESKVHGYSKLQLKAKVSYTTMKGNNGNSPLYQMLMHVVNHGTYHRGQLVTMLRELGKTEIPATDLMAFYREQSV